MHLFVFMKLVPQDDILEEDATEGNHIRSASPAFDKASEFAQEEKLSRGEGCCQDRAIPGIDPVLVAIQREIKAATDKRLAQVEDDACETIRSPILRRQRLSFLTNIIGTS